MTEPVTSAPSPDGEETPEPSPPSPSMASATAVDPTASSSGEHDPSLAASPPQETPEKGQAKKQPKPVSDPGSGGKRRRKGRKAAPNQSNPNQSSLEDTTFLAFDKIYNKPGKVQVFPHFVESKLTLYKRVKPTRPPPPADNVSGGQGAGRLKSPTGARGSCAEETSEPVTEVQQHGEEEGKTASEVSQDQAAESQDPVLPQKASVESSSTGKEKHTSKPEPKKKKKKIKDQVSYVLDEEKLTKPDVLEKLEAEDCEFLVLQRTKAALEEITGPDDPPVFLFHNQDLRSKAAKPKTGEKAEAGEKANAGEKPKAGEKANAGEKAEAGEKANAGEKAKAGEKDVIVLHPQLGVLLLEVKAVSKPEAFSRFDEATAQLLHAQASIQEEMGDLLEKDAVVLTIALPKLRPEDYSTIRGRAQGQSSSGHKRDVTPERMPEESGGAKGGRPRKLKEGAWLRDHPEVRLLCGSTAEVYTEWVRQLQQHRATSSHAFKGSTDQERLDNFKRACISRCSVPALHHRQSVKYCATLHGRWLLTEEQLRVRDSQAELLHLWGPPGSGKTLLLIQEGKRWLREGRPLVLAVKQSQQDILLYHLVQSAWEENADVAMVSTHVRYKDLLKTLEAASAKDPVSVILDEAMSPGEFYPKLLDHVRAGRIRRLWSAHTRPLPDELETALQREGGTTIQLRLCLRCPSHVMAWTNSVKEEEEPELLPPPVPVTREVGVEVELTCHPDHPHQFWDKCSACKEGVVTFFSGLGLLGSSTPSALSWRDVIVITTDEVNDRERVTAWLRGLGLPALAEKGPWKRYSTDVLLPGNTPQSPNQAEEEEARLRVLSGKDSKGRPALHIADCVDFIGLERPVVLLWHGDRKDEVRERQSQKHRDSRLSEHRNSWFRAASRCQGRLVVMATTPSPILSLLPTPHPTLDLSSVVTYTLSHHSHSPGGLLPCWECDQCGQGLVEKLQLLGLPVGSSPAAGSWREAVVVLSGWTCNGDGVAKWLQQMGIPAVFEEPQREKSNQAGEDDWQIRVAEWKFFVEAGVDKEGKPALHVMRNVPDMRPPAPVVVLVHHDEDDNDPSLQSQQKWDSRLQWQRYCWSRALSPSQEVVLLASTPSPLLALLQSPTAAPQIAPPDPASTFPPDSSS